MTGMAGWLGVSYYEHMATSPERTIEVVPSTEKKILVLAFLFLSWGVNQIINDYLGLKEDRINRPGDGEDIEVDVDRDGVVDFTFGEPDFRIVSLRTSAVLRWEFRPGSTLFVVWQQDRRGYESTGDLGASGAIWDTFEAPGSNVFAVKVAYWLGR